MRRLPPDEWAETMNHRRLKGRIVVLKMTSGRAWSHFLGGTLADE